MKKVNIILAAMCISMYFLYVMPAVAQNYIYPVTPKETEEKKKVKPKVIKKEVKSAEMTTSAPLEKPEPAGHKEVKSTETTTSAALVKSEPAKHDDAALRSNEVSTMTIAAVAGDAKSAGLNADDVKKALGLSIYLQGGITVNGNASSPAGAGVENDLRVFDHKANSFGLDLMEIVFSREPATGVPGYKVKVAAGETAKFIHAAGLGSQPTGTANQESFDITEAYISYTAAGKGLRFDVGKMATFFGAEVIEAIDNPNYSRSFLFNYAIPFTHTGLKASYVFNDHVNASFHLVNGWDNATDNNTGKSVGVSVNLAAGDPFSAFINYMQGPEQADNNHDKRSLTDLVATIKPIKPLAIILNYDSGKEDMGSAASVKWSGFAGIVKYDINDRYSISVRAESFDDKDGARTGTIQKLTEYTITPEIRLAGGLVLRPEYRHDLSDKLSFSNGAKKTQDTYAVAAMYRW